MLLANNLWLYCCDVANMAAQRSLMTYLNLNFLKFIRNLVNKLLVYRKNNRLSLSRINIYWSE
jgi:hypothetical protein